jgi:hypothetical protein
MIRDALFLLGLLVMGLALAIAAVPANPDTPRRAYATWAFGLGLLIATGTHGWPEGFR